MVSPEPKRPAIQSAGINGKRNSHHSAEKLSRKNPTMAPQAIVACSGKRNRLTMTRLANAHKPDHKSNMAKVLSGSLRIEAKVTRSIWVRYASKQSSRKTAAPTMTAVEGEFSHNLLLSRSTKVGANE